MVLWSATTPCVGISKSYQLDFHEDDLLLFSCFINLAVVVIFSSSYPFCFFPHPTPFMLAYRTHVIFLPIWSRWVNPFRDCCTSVLSTQIFPCAFPSGNQHLTSCLSNIFHSSFMDSLKHRENWITPFKIISFALPLSVALVTAALPSQTFRFIWVVSVSVTIIFQIKKKKQQYFPSKDIIIARDWMIEMGQTCIF